MSIDIATHAHMVFMARHISMFTGDSMGEILSIISRWLWGERDDEKKPSEKLPLISPPRLGSYGNSSSSRPELQPNLITSPQSLGSCRDYTLPTILQTRPLPPPSSSSSAFSHSKISGTSRFQPTPQTHHQPNLSSCGLSSTTEPSPVHPKLETHYQLSSSSCSHSSTTHFSPKLEQTHQSLSSISCGISRPSGTSHAQPKIQTHPSLLPSSCSHSSPSGPSHFQPKPVTVPLSSVPSSNSGINGALQRNTPSFPLSLCSNSRSDDASDLFIPPKLKIQVVGDEKQVSAGLQQYNRIEQKEERTRGVVGKNRWDYSICEEEEVVSRVMFKERSIYNYNSCEEEDQEEGKLSRGVLVKERWIKHYSSEHKILLVGEGDFSFSASLAVAFDSATNITATSLDSIEFLSSNYGRALSNIDKVQSLGAQVMHDVDATKMAKVFPFKYMCFDRVVYNFPLAGFFPDESSETEIWRHRMLVQLFLENARKMIHIDGEIHITHKSNGFFYQWNLELLASRVGLRLIEEVPFNVGDYPGYCTKYGFGGDDDFNCNPSKTYKFGQKKPTKKPSYRFMTRSK